MKCSRCRKEKETVAYSTPIGSANLCQPCLALVVAEWWIHKQDVDVMKES